MNVSDHLFHYSIIALCVEQNSKVLWKNHTPNNVSSTRPAFLLRAEEGDESVLNLVIPATDVACEELTSVRIKCK